MPRYLDEHAANVAGDALRRRTRMLDHEKDALSSRSINGKQADEEIFAVLGRVDVATRDIHKALVDWFVRSPDKPSRDELDKVFSLLHQLRDDKVHIDDALGAIEKREIDMLRLTVQLAKAQQSIADVQQYLDKYLDAVR